MKKFQKMMIAFAAILMFTALPYTTVMAAQTKSAEPYRYTITVSTGSDDIFFSTAGIDGSIGTGNQKLDGVTSELSADKTVLFIRNVPYGATIKLTEGNNALEKLDTSASIYHVKGIRQAGHDETNSGVIAVTGDADYVVAYGVITNPVHYTVKYVDQSGKELLPEDTFIGNIGEKVDVAFRSADGYLPDVFRQKMTLSEQEADNVFVFTYHLSRGVNVIYNSVTGEATYIYEDGTTTTVLVPAENVTPGAALAGGAAGNADNAGNAGNNPADAADNNPADAGNNAADENVIPDEETPLVTQDVVDLDDEDVPLADKAASAMTNAAPIIAGAVVVLAAAGIATTIVLLRKRKIVFPRKK